MPANRVVPLVGREPLEGGYLLLTFAHAEAAHEARPGQFVMIKAGTSAEPPLRRPFSILAVDPSQDTFTLLLKAVGRGGHALAALRVRDVAQCLGPLGQPFAAPADGSEALMVAGGYGIAPFLMLSRELLSRRAKGRVFYGGRTVTDLQVRGRFEELGIDLVPSTQDGSLGHKGLVIEPLEDYLDNLAGRAATLFACGPDAMLRAVARIAERRTLPCQVSVDPWMGCGVGTCLGCVVKIQGRDERQPKYRCACTEGPVFDAATVVWGGDDTSAAFRREGAS